MSEYVSNVPVSRPRNTGWEVHWDCNGLVWNNDHGFFFQPVDPVLPIKKPARRPQGGN